MSLTRLHTAVHLWGPRFTLFTTIWSHSSSSTWCTTKQGVPMEALVLDKDISPDNREYSKPFEGTQT